MSYQSRKKKRAKKQAAAQRRKGGRTGDTARRWFLTLAKKPGKFDCCGRPFERGGEIVYRHQGKQIRCTECADRDPDCRYRASLRWERARRLPKAA